MVRAREMWKSQIHWWFRRGSQGPGWEGSTWVSRGGCTRPGQHDLGAAQGSGELCRNTAGGVRSENIYRAQTGSSRVGAGGPLGKQTLVMSSGARHIG